VAARQRAGKFLPRGGLGRNYAPKKVQGDEWRRTKGLNQNKECGGGMGYTQDEIKIYHWQSYEQSIRG